ncbi:hypothetical protein BpHYR1_037412 [Brachionus plicatilis]|uniref:Uncharacterized protein n=1 Tax=Brachionus plicatilis TaxID=10195 RepID=A0A3M7SQ91_BRAPC|nr:hypothetical protein BpHYR1_037412 [Brachionus plicatilis]
MSGKEVRFDKRSGRKNLASEQTPCSVFTKNYYGNRSRSTSSKKMPTPDFPTPSTCKSSKNLTLINSFDIMRPGSSKHQSSPDELSECDDEDYDPSEETTDSQSDDDSLSIRNCMLQVDENCNKVITGRDLISMFYSFSEWFNGLRDSFVASTPIQSSGNRDSKSPRSNSCPSRGKIFYDSIEKVTGDLTKDKTLRLRYDPGDQAKPWDESDICKIKKFITFIEKKCNFYDKLEIIPGIGSAYNERLREFVPNVGTLLELYMTVDEMTFKALLKCYSRMKNTDVNYVFTSCKRYHKKYGFTFGDVIVRSPDYSSKTNSSKKIFI